MWLIKHTVTVICLTIRLLSTLDRAKVYVVSNMQRELAQHVWHELDPSATLAAPNDMKHHSNADRHAQSLAYALGLPDLVGKTSGTFTCFLTASASLSARNQRKKFTVHAFTSFRRISERALFDLARLLPANRLLLFSR